MITHRLNHLIYAIQLLLLLAVLFLPELAWAADDLLKGSESSLKETVLKTGKLFVYLIEAIIAIALYIKSRNLLVFVGVIVIAVFIEILSKKFLVAV